MTKVMKPSHIDAAREQKDRNIVKRLCRDKTFSDRVETATRMLRSGKNFFEIREILGVTSEELWSDIKYVAVKRVYSPEGAAYEIIAVTRGHYEEAYENYLLALKSEDSDVIGRAIMVMSTMEQRKFEVLKELNMIKAPVEIDGGTGFASTDVIDVENEMREKLESRIISQMEIAREAQKPESVTLLPRNEPDGPADIVEQTPLVKNDSSG